MAVFASLLLSAVLVATCVGIWALQAAVFCPLKHVPGPWYTLVSNLPLKFATLGGRRIFFIDDLHRRYGTCVRIAPDEIDVVDVTALKQVYAVGSGFNKTRWYKNLLQFEYDNAFSMTDPKTHQQRRKLFAKQYSRTAIKSGYGAFMKAHVELTMGKIRALTEEGDVDILKWFVLLMSDVASRMVFGEMLGGVESGETSPFIQRLTAFTIVGGIGSELPWIPRIGRYVPYLRDFLDREKLLARAAEAVQLAKSSEEEISVLSAAIKDGSVDGDVAGCELIGMMVGGVDTTATTLTYLIWAVLRRPELQDEVETLVSKLPANFTDNDVEKVPLLNGIVEESLRLYGSAPGSLPREVPQGGRTIAGYFIPQGLTVTSQAYSYHRLPKLFPDPERFEPRRWYPESAMTADAKVAFHPFGIGPQICAGIVVARMELRLGMATFFRICKGARLSASTTPASMEMVNHFLIMPTSHRCCVTMKA